MVSEVYNEERRCKKKKHKNREREREREKEKDGVGIREGKGGGGRRWWMEEDVRGCWRKRKGEEKKEKR